MKIAIISDTHDNVPNLEKALSWMKKNNIKEIIHCGDLCAPGILVNTLAPGFTGQIHMVFGNVEDRDELTNKVDNFKHVHHYGDQGEIKIDGSTIGFVHFPEKAEKMAKTGKFDIVFHGHTHKPWEKEVNGIKVVNPGTLAGLFQKATFAVYDTESEKLELKILEKI